MTCFLPQTKGDRRHKGSTFKAPALARLCPVTAYMDWIELTGLRQGAVFRRINRWGHVAENGLHINSLIPLLRSAFSNAGLEYAEEYTGHSLRRGFAQWATSSGWDIKTLMAYVGWKTMQSALRYVDASDPFSQLREEKELPLPA